MILVESMGILPTGVCTGAESFRSNCTGVGSFQSGSTVWRSLAISRFLLWTLHYISKVEVCKVGWSRVNLSLLGSARSSVFRSCLLSLLVAQQRKRHDTKPGGLDSLGLNCKTKMAMDMHGGIR